MVQRGAGPDADSPSVVLPPVHPPHRQSLEIELGLEQLFGLDQGQGQVIVVRRFNRVLPDDLAETGRKTAADRFRRPTGEPLPRDGDPRDLQEGAGQAGYGPGDDAAIVGAPDGRTVLSIDTQVQDQDFRLQWPNGHASTGYDVGWKAAEQPRNGPPLSVI